MKKYLISLLLIFITVSSYGQVQWNIDFEDTTYQSRIFIDTISNANCIWQVGHPSKAIFSSAYSAPKAIVTDTVYPYPTNDTSSFIITHIRPGQFGGNESLLLDFYFKVNSDSLTDYGMIEASLDNGLRWINLLTEDTTYGLYWLTPKPAFTGTTNGWTHYSEQLSGLTWSIGYSDTILYRFTFISDSIQTNKEGWMLDEFLLNDWWEGINETQSNDLISIYPNPVTDRLVVHRTKYSDKSTIQILNCRGQVLYDDQNFLSETFDTRTLPNGIYLIRYSDSKHFANKVFVVNH